MKYNAPKKVDIEFTDEEKRAIETTYAIVDELWNKMKKDDYDTLGIDDNCLDFFEMTDLKENLEFLFQNYDRLYLE